MNNIHSDDKIWNIERGGRKFTVWYTYMDSTLGAYAYGVTDVATGFGGGGFAGTSEQACKGIDMYIAGELGEAVEAKLESGEYVEAAAIVASQLVGEERIAAVLEALFILLDKCNEIIAFPNSKASLEEFNLAIDNAQALLGRAKPEVRGD